MPSALSLPVISKLSLPLERDVFLRLSFATSPGRCRASSAWTRRRGSSALSARRWAMR